MKSPLLVSCGGDAWLAEQFREIAADSRWLAKTFSPAGLEKLLSHDRPTVVALVADPRDALTPLAALAELNRTHPEVGVAVLTATKITEDDRAAWLALVLDLGARAVLFPPYTRLVLDDLFGGLMTICCRRAGLPTEIHPRPTDADGAIDLASGDYEEPA